jgi:hypothetical protein
MDPGWAAGHAPSCQAAAAQPSPAQHGGLTQEPLHPGVDAHVDQASHAQVAGRRAAPAAAATAAAAAAADGERVVVVDTHLRAHQCTGQGALLGPSSCSTPPRAPRPAGCCERRRPCPCCSRSCWRGWRQRSQRRRCTGWSPPHLRAARQADRRAGSADSSSSCPQPASHPCACESAPPAGPPGKAGSQPCPALRHPALPGTQRRTCALGLVVAAVQGAVDVGRAGVVRQWRVDAVDLRQRRGQQQRIQRRVQRRAQGRLPAVRQAPAPSAAAGAPWQRLKPRRMAAAPGQQGTTCCHSRGP